MTLLSSPVTEIAPEYDVVVVGSGYGGSIAAARLARAGKPDGARVRVCLLERGREIPVGRFPDELATAARQIQVDAPAGHAGDAMGLFDVRRNDDITVVQGCGLGGTSLINANVSLEAEDWVLDDPAWPAALRDDRAQGLEAGYARARAMLRPSPHPDPMALPKYAAHKKSAEAMGRADCFYSTPINVTFTAGLNHVGVEQPACNGCGDCVTGCNVGAKNTLMMNYLPDARGSGAEIYCGIGVRRVAKVGERFAVYYQPLDMERDKFDAPELFVIADVVILAAGALGSSEIALRSKAQGLACSDEIGKRFTGNGDVLGFGYNNDERINGVGLGAREFEPAQQVGPCITSVIDLRRSFDAPEDGFVIEEGSLPSALAPVLGGALQAAAAITGQDTDAGAWDRAKEIARAWSSAAPGGAYRGAAANTQTYLIMAHDDGGGRLSLREDRLRVAWPGLGRQPVFERANEALLEATKALGGTYVPSPTFNKLFDYELVTVHPLGGCCMGEDATSGVVNHKGQMFSGSAGQDVYAGLYVMDGSVLPRPVGVNPLLTISAVSERNVHLLAADRGWTIADDVRSGRAQYDGRWEKDDLLRVQFTERMAGYYSTDVLDDFDAAHDDGKVRAQSCEFVLTILSADLRRMVETREHAAGMVGTFECSALSARPLTASGARFELFSADPDTKDGKRMQYTFTLTSETGQRFYFHGVKRVLDDAGQDLWSDTSTLYITVYEGGDDGGRPLVKGRLQIAPADFAKQMTTMRASDSEGARSIEGTIAFGRFFAGQLWDTYFSQSADR